MPLVVCRLTGALFIYHQKTNEVCTEERKDYPRHSFLTEDFGVEARKNYVLQKMHRLDVHFQHRLENAPGWMQLFTSSVTQISAQPENYDYTEAPPSQVGMGSYSLLAGDPHLCGEREARRGRLWGCHRATASC